MLSVGSEQPALKVYCFQGRCFLFKKTKNKQRKTREKVLGKQTRDVPHEAPKGEKMNKASICYLVFILYFYNRKKNRNGI